MSRLFRYTLVSVAALVALAVLCLGFLFWKISAAPVTSTELTPYVEAALARFVPGGEAKIEHTSFAWDNIDYSLSLACDGVKIRDAQGAMVASFPSVNLKIGVWSALRGRLLPIEMKADDAQFWATRRKDGAWMAGGVTADAKASDSGVDIFSILQDIGDEIANQYLNHAIAIKRAVWAVHDETIDKDWLLTAREITLDHRGKKAEGRATIEVAQGDHSSSVDALYRYDRKEKRHQIELSFQDINLAALASQHPKLAMLALADVPLSGTISFGADRDLNLSDSAISVKGGAGTLENAALWDRKLPVKGLSLAAHFDQDEGKLTLDNFSVDFNGPKLNVTGEAETPFSRNFVWAHPRQSGALTAEITLEALPMDRFAEIWPKTAIPNARSWIALHMSKGKFDGGVVKLEGKVDWNDPAQTQILSGAGGLAASGARIAYMDGMPPVDDASAEASFDLKKMDVKILSGHTGDIKIEPFTLSMTDLEKDTQYITIPLRLTGPTQSVLKLLDAPPLGYAKRIGLNPADTEGTAEGTLTLRFPMLDALLLKDIAYKAEAQFRNFGLRNKIPHVTASQGDLAFRLNDEGFELEGPIALNKVPLSLVWKSRFDARQSGLPIHEATVTGAFKDDSWAAFELGGVVNAEGAAPVKIHYENLRDGFSTLSGEIDFKPAAAHILPFSLNKPRGVPAALSFAAEIKDGENIKVTSLNLQGKGLNVKGTAELDSKTGELRKAAFDPYIVARSNATVSYTDDPDGAVAIVAQGRSLDIAGPDETNDKRKKEKKAEAQTPAPPPRARTYQIKVGRLYTSKTGFMSKFSLKAERDKQGWKSIDLDGAAQGEVPVDISLATQGGVSVFSLHASDFGQLLHGLGLTDTIKGGTINVNGKGSKEDPRAVEGKVKINSFTVSGLPILARLLSAVSPFGFMDLITGEAAFDHMRGNFLWEGDRVEISKMRAAGSVVGINLDGHMDFAKSETNLNGTLVPFSFVNSVIGSIPLLGDMITGGDGQGVIAAAFTVKGPMSDPEISVNPVSLLTPGFLRNLFFSGDDGEEATDKP